MALKYLGIDQSLLHPAVAILDEMGNLVHSETLSVGAAVRGAARLLKIVAWVQAAIAIDPAGPYHGAIEGPSLGSQHREFDLGEVSGAIKYAAKACAIDLTVVAPTQLKLFATGKGLHANTATDPRRSKHAVLHAVKEVWGADFGEDDNACDAYVLARIARALHTRQFTRRCQADVVETLLRPKARRPPRVRLDPATNI